MPQNKADRKITHTISNVIPSGKVFVLIGILKDFPIVMLQDSKHALKTFPNNLFTEEEKKLEREEEFNDINKDGELSGIRLYLNTAHFAHFRNSLITV
ncbi:hypothetical protein B0H14DRAFT_3511898 [Mycena olivaceomarginata]|nr:hypothetical protein B0H14DRAFT_3511898 [Mycena olivaceomarginata]